MLTLVASQADAVLHSMRRWRKILSFCRPSSYESTPSAEITGRKDNESVNTKRKHFVRMLLQNVSDADRYVR